MIVRNRECCYWKKPECTWEHCQEITARNIHREDGERIIQEKKCGSFAAEKFLIALAEKQKDKEINGFGEFLRAFIEDGSDVINEMVELKSCRK